MNGAGRRRARKELPPTTRTDDGRGHELPFENGGDITKKKRKKREKLTALGAYRAGKLPLPPGYYLEFDPDILALRREDGSLAAAFSAAGASPSEVVRAAEEDYRASGKHGA